MVLAIASVALAERPPESVRAIGAGAAAAVVAVVVQAGIGLARGSLAGRRGGSLARALAYVAAGAAVTVAFGALVVLAILAAGAIELAWRRRPGVAVHAWPLAAALLAAGTGTLPGLAWTAFKVGALAYGGGFVIVPLMYDDAVVRYGWMTAEQFANAVAYGQLTPGPVTQTVAFVGWAAAGPGGALLAAAVAFAPSFVAIGIGGRRFTALRTSGAARAFLDGAGPAAVGAVLGAAVPLVRAIAEPWQVAVLAAAAAALLARRAPVWVLLGGALAGLAAALAGLAVPGGGG
jgi:chromate transporter